MRLLVLLTVAMAGCQATDYRPYAAAVMGHMRHADPPPPPTGCPGGGDCDGRGYLGDGTVKVDCPACDIWQGELPVVRSEPEASSASTHTRKRRIRRLRWRRR